MLEKTNTPVIIISIFNFDPKAEEYPSILTLCKAHADELRVFSILQLNIDETRYIELQSKGKLLALIAKDEENKVRAYSTHFIHKHPHYQQVWVGQEDTIYVEPELRRHGVGRQLRETALKELKQRGCRLVTARTKFGHEDDTNLNELGFKEWEICWARMI